MALIRKEDLLKEFNHGGLVFPSEVRRIINEQVTVEAIPISYLKNTADMLAKTRVYVDTVTANNIENIIAAWRLNHETD